MRSARLSMLSHASRCASLEGAVLEVCSSLDCEPRAKGRAIFLFTLLFTAKLGDLTRLPAKNFNGVAFESITD